MTGLKPPSKRLASLIKNVVALLIGFPLALWGLFMIGLSDMITPVALGAGLGFVAYRLAVWPAIAIIAAVIFGLAVTADAGVCAIEPSCDGTSADAWPEYPLAVLLFVGLMMTGAVSGFIRFLRFRGSPSSREKEGL